MSLDTLIDNLPDTAKDTRLNLKSILTEEGAPGLTRPQIFGTALASAYATRSLELIAALEEESKTILSAEELAAAKAAATIMAMNNIYYRFIHIASDDEIKKMPANLRMQVIANPGIPHIDFEIYALAVSAINGCGMCMETHARKLEASGLTKLGIQSSIRLAAIINAAAQALV